MKETLKNIWRRKAPKMGFGAQNGLGGSVGDVRGDTDYPQPDMSGLDSGCVYRNEAHTLHMSLLPPLRLKVRVGVHESFVSSRS